MNKILKLTVILFLVCAITAGILGAVYNLTEGPIEMRKTEKTAKAYAAVLPSDSYTPVDEAKYANFSGVDKIEKADNDSGHVVQLTVVGAQGEITLVVGVGSDNTCTGISIINHSETSGLGAKAADTGDFGINWRAQFVGEGEDIALAKNGGNIDAITAATITSRAVTNAVATAVSAVKSLG